MHLNFWFLSYVEVSSTKCLFKGNMGLFDILVRCGLDSWVMNSGVVEYGSNCVTFSLTILRSRRSHIQRFHTNYLPTLHCNPSRPD